MKFTRSFVLFLWLAPVAGAQDGELQEFLERYIDSGSREYALKIREVAPGSPQDLFCRAWERRASEPEEAMEIAEELVTGHPGFAAGYLLLGALQMDEELEHEKAIETLDRAVSLDPGLSLAYLKRGMARMYCKDYRKALEDFEQVLELQRNNAQAILFSGVARFRLGDDSELVRDFEMAIQMDNMIVSDHFSQDLKLAMDRAVGISPDNVNIFFARGLAMFGQGFWKQASEDFSRAIALVPGNADYYKYSGASKYYMKDEEGAEEDLKMSLRINPDDPETYYYLGLWATNLKNLPQRGYEYMSGALALDDEQADYYYQRAKSSYELTEYGSALSDVRQALDMQQNNGNYYALRGMIRLKLRQEDSLICGDFERAYELGTFYKIRRQYRKHCK